MLKVPLKEEVKVQLSQRISLVFTDVLSYSLPFNDIEVVAIIVLVNYVLAVHTELLKHGIQHL